MSFHAALAHDSRLLCLYTDGFKHWKQKIKLHGVVIKIKIH